ncbi:MAG: hypothetical protein VB070_11920 [Clostridiaceae bacterium]|nr:hypothetical protein [Clostridiaceae bacterium]
MYFNVFPISSTSFTKPINKTVLADGIYAEEGVGPEIVALYDDYINGKIKNSEKIDPDIKAMFANNVEIPENSNVDTVYNVKQIELIDNGSILYEATALTIVTLIVSFISK